MRSRQSHSHQVSQLARRSAVLAGAIGLLLASRAVQADQYYWDPTQTNSTTGTGAGTWDDATANWWDATTSVGGQYWPNTTPNSDEAVFANATAATTVKVGNTPMFPDIYVNKLTFNSGNYTIATNANGGVNGVLHLDGPGAQINVIGGGGATITVGMTTTGLSELDVNTSQAMDATTPYQGALTLNPGAGLASSTTPNGVPILPNTFNIGHYSVDGLTSYGRGSKLIINGASNQISGAGPFVKNGPGWMTIYSNNNAAVNTSGTGTYINNAPATGAWTLNDGVIEAGNANALGTGAITINGANLVTGTQGAELSANTGGTFTNAITLNGGVLSGDNWSGTLNTVFSGAMTVSADSTLRLGNFYGAGSGGKYPVVNMAWNGTVTGTGNLAVIDGYGNPGQSPAGQLLNLTGDISGYTGNINIGTGHNINLGTNLGGTGFGITLASSTTAMSGVGFGFDTAVPTSIITDNSDPAASTVLGINSGGFAHSVDLSTLGNGKWFLGSQTGGTYWGSTLTPATDGVYRLGGGGATVNIGNAVVTGNNTVQVGNNTVNGGGGVQFLAQQTYTGATNIVNGTLQAGYINGTSPAPDTVVNDSIPTGTVITFGSLNGTATVPAYLDLHGTTQHLTAAQSLNVATGADPTQMKIGNSSTRAPANLVIDTTNGSTTWAGIIQDKLGSGTQPLALTVQGTNPANAFIITGTAAHTGGTTINGATLQVGNGGTTGSLSGAVVNNGTLVYNRSDAVGPAAISGSGQVIQNGTGSLGLSSGNSFSGGLVVNAGTASTGMNLTGATPLGSGTVTLAGGKLQLQGTQSLASSPSALAPVTVTGFTMDAIYAASDTGKYPNNTSTTNSLMDGYYSYYQNNFVAPAGQAQAGTVLTSGGFTGQSFTSAITNTVAGGHTPGMLGSFTDVNILQILGGKNGAHTGTLTLSQPGVYKNLAVFAVSSWAGDDTPNVTIHFADGTSVTTTYNAFDWSIGTDATKVAADAFAGSLNRYAPANGATGWDQRPFGIYETDIDLTKIGGIDYSNRLVSSMTFSGLTSNLTQDQRTNIFAVSGQNVPFLANAMQTYANNVAVTAPSGLDVSGSLHAQLGNLALGSTLSVTSADTTTNPFGVSFGATTVSGSAGIDVAASAGGGAGTVTLASTSGTGSLAKSNAGTLVISGAASHMGGTSVQGGVLTVDGPVASSNISIASGATLNGSGTLTWNLNGNTGDLITNAGTLNISALNLALNITGTQSQSEYVIADDSAAGASLLGSQFASVTGLPSGAALHYTGTTAHPSSIVLSLANVVSYIKGDMNGDGSFNNFDITPFVLALTDVNTYKANYPKMTSIYQQVGDMNNDGSFNNFDITPFVTALTSPHAAEQMAAALASVPEPASLGLLALGGMAMLRRRRSSR